MHTLLVLSTLLLLVAGCFLLFTKPHESGAQQRRQPLRLLLLTLPLVGVGLGALSILHFAQVACFTRAPHWDQVVSVLLPGGLIGGFLVGLVLSLVRLLLVWVTVARGTFAASRRLHRCTRRLARHLGVHAPRVRLCPSLAPVAFTYGIFQPTIVLSRWMVETLDQQELESVLAHELAHHARRDHLLTWWALLLRDAFCYLPTSRLTYQQFRDTQELACDDLATQVTRQPLGLANALTKVWLHTLSHQTQQEAVPALTGTGTQMEGRIRRLFTPAVPAQQDTSIWMPLLSRCCILLCLFLLGLLNVLMILNLMGCGPLS
jgi:Zn-dependent protease with chaperone function